MKRLLIQIAACLTCVLCAIVFMGLVTATGGKLELGTAIGFAVVLTVWYAAVDILFRK